MRTVTPVMVLYLPLPGWLFLLAWAIIKVKGFGWYDNMMRFGIGWFVDPKTLVGYGNTLVVEGLY